MSLQEGLRLVQLAVKADEQQEIGQAIKLYELSLVKFHEALRNEQTPTVLPQKIKEYTLRTQLLKSFIENQSKPNELSSNQSVKLPSQVPDFVPTFSGDGFSNLTIGDGKRSDAPEFVPTFSQNFETKRSDVPESVPIFSPKSEINQPEIIPTFSQNVHIKRSDVPEIIPTFSQNVHTKRSDVPEIIPTFSQNFQTKRSDVPEFVPTFSQKSESKRLDIPEIIPTFTPKLEKGSEIPEFIPTFSPTSFSLQPTPNSSMTSKQIPEFVPSFSRPTPNSINSDIPEHVPPFTFGHKSLNSSDIPEFDLPSGIYNSGIMSGRSTVTQYPSFIPDGPVFNRSVPSLFHETGKSLEIRTKPEIQGSITPQKISVPSPDPSSVISSTKTVTVIPRKPQQSIEASGILDSIDFNPITNSITEFNENGKEWLPDKSTSNLQLGLDLVEEAKLSDQNKEYKRALQLYTDALEHFSLALKDVGFEAIKSSLQQTMHAYINRAEAIKEYLEKTGELPPPSAKSSVNNDDRFDAVQVETEKTVFIPGNKKGVDLRIGPIERESQNTFLLDQNPVLFKVNIGQNLITPGQSLCVSISIINRSSVKVRQLKISLQQTETTAVIDKSGKRIYKRNSTCFNSFSYSKGFPLQKNTHEGLLEYTIPKTILLSDTDNSSCFAREYEILFIFVMERFHKDVTISFPVRITDTV